LKNEAIINYKEEDENENEEEEKKKLMKTNNNNPIGKAKSILSFVKIVLAPYLMPNE
jgi:membrane protein insertase Oxa1/YidC/SpoIIIJ